MRLVIQYTYVSKKGWPNVFEDLEEVVSAKEETIKELLDRKAALSELNERNNQHLSEVQAELEEKRTELADITMSLKDKSEEVENQQQQVKSKKSSPNVS